MPEAGLHYPGSYAQLRAWFPDDDACLDYLDWLRWPYGFECPMCGDVVAWEMEGKVLRCSGCRRRVSRTVGTIFERTHTPLTLWFAAAWHMTSQKTGVSALALQRLLELGSYQTAWVMLHRYRRAMVIPGRDMLAGRVEVDETFIGGPKPGKRGRGAAGKTEVLVAVELKEPLGFGRVRLRVIPDTGKPTLREALKEMVGPGATIVSDGHQSYPGATKGLWELEARAVAPSGKQAHELLPAVHRVASLLKRWLMGTHQGSVRSSHLQAYLDEFTFRFNRRRSTKRGLLFYRLLENAVRTDPATYADIRATPKPKRTSPAGRSGPRPTPKSLAVTEVGKPWRSEEALRRL